jgi:PTS system ascorbate-specific IIA component
MLSKLLTTETVQIQRGGDFDWRDAIKKAADPLLNQGKIEKSYVQAMITLVEKHGPYINIGPGIALAHARPENGVREMGISLLKVDPPIPLVNSAHPIQLFFVLAAVDNTKHLQVMKELAALLQNPDHVQKIENATSSSEIVQHIKEETEK